MSVTDKICPLKFNSKPLISASSYCEKEKCAWYMIDSVMCSILSLALDVENIRLKTREVELK